MKGTESSSLVRFQVQLMLQTKGTASERGEETIGERPRRAEIREEGTEVEVGCWMQ